MQERKGSHEHPADDDRDRLVQVAEAAGTHTWLVAVVDEAVEFIAERRTALLISVTRP